MSDLEAVLNGEQPVYDEAPPEVQEPEQVEAVAEAEPEPTGEEETSTPEVEAQPDPVAGLKAGITAERHKRQEAELRAKRLEQQVSQQQAKPDFWENPEGVLNGIAQGFQSQIQQVQTNMSVELMRTTHEDYDSMEASFIDMAQNNPALIQQMNQSGNPAKFAYDYAKAQHEINEMRDPSYKDKLRAEIRAELEAEHRKELEAEIQKRSTLPGTLSNDRAAGGNAAQPYSSPSLDSILPS